MVLVRPFTFGFHVVTPYKVVIKTPCMRPLDFFSGTSMIRHHCGVPNIYPLLTGRLKGNRLSLAHWEQNAPHCLLTTFKTDLCHFHETCPFLWSKGEKRHPKSQCGSENERGQQSHIIARRQWVQQATQRLRSCILAVEAIEAMQISHGERVGIHQSSSIFPA